MMITLRQQFGRRSVQQFTCAAGQLAAISDPHAVHVTNSSSYATQAAVGACPVTSSTKLKPFSAVPGPRGLPVIGTLWDYAKPNYCRNRPAKPNGYQFNKMFEILHERATKYGPIYKEKIGFLTSVIISDLDEYAKVIHVDGRFPNRYEMYPIVHYRNKKGMGLDDVTIWTE